MRKRKRGEGIPIEAFNFAMRAGNDALKAARAEAAALDEQNRELWERLYDLLSLCAQMAGSGNSAGLADLAARRRKRLAIVLSEQDASEVGELIGWDDVK